MKQIIGALNRHPWLVGGFIMAMLATLFFAAKMIFFTVYWSDPAHRNHVLQGWMTPGYVAHSWNVPRPVVLETLGTVSGLGQRKTLEQIAEDNGESLQELIVRIETAIAAHRSTR